MPLSETQKALEVSGLECFRKGTILHHVFEDAFNGVEAVVFNPNPKWRACPEMPHPISSRLARNWNLVLLSGTTVGSGRKIVWTEKGIVRGVDLVEVTFTKLMDGTFESANAVGSHTTFYRTACEKCFTWNVPEDQ